jgi:hypothetical protein
VGVNFKDGCRRLWIFGLVSLLVAGLVAATAVGARAPAGAAVFTHSAASGELRGGRLILHGVSGRVTWVTSSGRSGVVSLRRLHRRMFRRATPRATGTLHVVGYYGGDEPTFRLSKPRYNRARRTVSYKAKPLDNKPLPSASARAARSFGAASLSILGDPRAISGSDLHVCHTTMTNNRSPGLDSYDATAPFADWTLKPPDRIKGHASGSWSTQAKPDPLGTPIATG